MLAKIVGRQGRKHKYRSERFSTDDDDDNNDDSHFLLLVLNHNLPSFQ